MNLRTLAWLVVLGLVLMVGYELIGATRSAYPATPVPQGSTHAPGP